MVLVDPVVVSDAVTTVEPTQPQEQAPVDSTIDDGLPEKFKGKSAKEIADSYLAVESELGRARNEIGSSRRVIDELLQLRPRPTEKSTPEVRPVTPYDLAENPEETITHVAKRVADERTAGAEQRLAAIEQSMQVQAFEKKHPGYRDTLSSAQFQQWVQQSPLRVKLVQKAAEWDWDAGDELFALYKESASAQAPAQAPGKQTEAAKQASLAKSGGSGANKVVAGSDSKKIYRREELAHMYVHKPEEYDRLHSSGELTAAYKEKRVK